MKKKRLITWLAVLLSLVLLVVLLQQCNHEDLITFELPEVSEITLEELLSPPYVTMDKWTFLNRWWVDSHGVKTTEEYAEDDFYLQMAEEFCEILEGVTLHTYVPEEKVRNYDKHVKELLWENDYYPIKVRMTTGVLRNVDRQEDNREPRFVRLYGLDGSRYYLTIGYGDGINPEITAHAFYIDDPIAISQLAAFTYRIVQKYPGETADPEGVAVGGALKPMVFVNDKLYESANYDSGYTQISSNCVYLGEIKECVGYSNAPTENFQANHYPVGTKVYQYYSVILLGSDGKYYAYTEVPEEPGYFDYSENLEVSLVEYQYSAETGKQEIVKTPITLTEEEKQILTDLLEPYADTITTDVLRTDYTRYYCIQIDDRITLTIDPELGNYGDEGDSYMFVMKSEWGSYIRGTYINAELVNFLGDRLVKEGVEFPFELEDVANIEMINFGETPGQVEKKIVVAEDDIKTLYDMFERASLSSERISTDTSGGSTISFTFHLVDGTAYELTYIGYGIKNGILKSSTGNFEYYTLADIGGFWFITDLEAVTAEGSELLQ